MPAVRVKSRAAPNEICDSDQGLFFVFIFSFLVPTELFDVFLFEIGGEPSVRLRDEEYLVSLIHCGCVSLCQGLQKSLVLLLEAFCVVAVGVLWAGRRGRRIDAD